MLKLLLCFFSGITAGAIGFQIGGFLQFILLTAVVFWLAYFYYMFFAGPIFASIRIDVARDMENFITDNSKGFLFCVGVIVGGLALKQF